MTDNTIHLKNSIRPTPYSIISRTAYTSLHLHPHVEIAYIVKGRYAYTIGDEFYELQAGDVFFLPPYTLHSFRVETEDCERIMVAFKPDDLGVIGDLLQKNRLVSCVIRKEQLDNILPKIDLLIRDLLWKLNNKNSFRRLSAYNDLTTICTKLAEITGLTKVSQMNSPLCKKALEICNTNFNQVDFNSNKVAEILYVSRSHIEQLFLQEMHMSIKKYIIVMRINYAESLLRETALPITTIAPEAGFGSVRTFNRLFYGHKHMTPQEWRNAHRK